MFAKSLLTIALVALSVSASPVQCQYSFIFPRGRQLTFPYTTDAGTSEASLYERSLVPELYVCAFRFSICIAA